MTPQQHGLQSFPHIPSRYHLSCSTLLRSHHSPCLQVLVQIKTVPHGTAYIQAHASCIPFYEDLLCAHASVCLSCRKLLHTISQLMLPASGQVYHCSTQHCIHPSPCFLYPSAPALIRHPVTRSCVRMQVYVCLVLHCSVHITAYASYFASIPQLSQFAPRTSKPMLPAPCSRKTYVHMQVYACPVVHCAIPYHSTTAHAACFVSSPPLIHSALHTFDPILPAPRASAVPPIPSFKNGLVQRPVTRLCVHMQGYACPVLHYSMHITACASCCVSSPAS